MKRLLMAFAALMVAVSMWADNVTYKVKYVDTQNWDSVGVVVYLNDPSYPGAKTWITDAQGAEQMQSAGDNVWTYVFQGADTLAEKAMVFFIHGMDKNLTKHPEEGTTPDSLKNYLVEARDFKGFTLDLRQNPTTLPDGVLLSGAWVDKVHGYGPEEGQEYGELNIKVDGPVLFTVGGCEQGESVQMTDPDGQKSFIWTSSVGCDDETSMECYREKVYDGGPGNITFSFKRLPYIVCKPVDPVVHYYSADRELLMTDTFALGSNLSYSAEAEGMLNIDRDKVKFRRWVDDQGHAVHQGSLVDRDLYLYAMVTDIENPVSGNVFNYVFTPQFYIDDHEAFRTTSTQNDLTFYGLRVGAGGMLQAKVCGDATVTFSISKISKKGGTITVTDKAGNPVGDPIQTPNLGTDTVATVKYMGDATTLIATCSAECYIQSMTVSNLAYENLNFTNVDDKAIDIAFTRTSTFEPEAALKYSTDSKKWADYTFDTPITVEAGAKVYFTASKKNATFNTATKTIKFTSTGKVAANGNILALLSPDCEVETLPDYAFALLFDGCTGLTQAPKMPATALGAYCYSSMYAGCTSLTQAPELPATELKKYCYNAMFSGCTALERVPMLHATSLVECCYRQMFMDCANLSRLGVDFTDWTSTNATQQWLSGVAETGTFCCPEALDTKTTGTSTLPQGWTASRPITLVLTAGEGGTTIECNQAGAMKSVPALQYSTDLATWQDCSYVEGNSNHTITLAEGQKAYFRAKGINTTFSEGSRKYVGFKTQGQFSLSGNVMALLAGDGSIEQLPEEAFYCLFDGCEGLTALSEDLLPATDLSTECYYMMFAGCNGFTSLPEKMLPATTMAEGCYNMMFMNCNSLTELPANLLPATHMAMACYRYMFNGCENLVKVPALPADTLAQNCYQGMFASCPKLEIAPDLPATELAPCCYQEMFSKCEGLTTAPALNAKRLEGNCYQEMFLGCTALTNVPDIQAETMASSCCFSMFNTCTSLVTAPQIYASKMAPNCCKSMFEGCESLVTPPELPATRLDDYCYAYMFGGCLSLETAPVLPAPVLMEGCYEAMFQRCEKIKEIKASFSTWTVTGSWYDMPVSQDWLDGVAEQGKFICTSGLDVTTIERGGSTIPEGWEIEASVTVPVQLSEDDGVYPSAGVWFEKTTYDIDMALTLKKGQWNTLGLPFDMTKEELETQFGEGTKVMKMTGMEGDVADFVTVENLEAAEACIVMPTKDVTALKLTGKSGLKNNYNDEHHQMVMNGDYFVQVYFNKWMAMSTFYVLEIQSTGSPKFEMNGDKLDRVTEDKLLKAYHWMLVNTAKDTTAQQIKMSLDGVVTGIETLSSNQSASTNSAMYNLAGQRVNAVQKGIVIVNGHKVVK